MDLGVAVLVLLVLVAVVLPTAAYLQWRHSAAAERG